MAGQSHILRWEAHHTNMADEIFELGCANAACNVAITNGQEYVLVHTVILAACSPLYKSTIPVSGKIFKRSF
jgi:hypothetical protein